MDYKVRFKKSVGKDLRKIHPKDQKSILDRIDEVLPKNPIQFPTLKGQFAGLRKFRIGVYRVIFSILGDEVWILRIGHQKDIYK